MRTMLIMKLNVSPRQSSMVSVSSASRGCTFKCTRKRTKISKHVAKATSRKRPRIMVKSSIPMHVWKYESWVFTRNAAIMPLSKAGGNISKIKLAYMCVKIRMTMSESMVIRKYFLAGLWTLKLNHQYSKAKTVVTPSNTYQEVVFRADVSMYSTASISPYWLMKKDTLNSVSRSGWSSGCGVMRTTAAVNSVVWMSSHVFLLWSRSCPRYASDQYLRIEHSLLPL
mmetsp:Transcript_14109/g.41891  ORF Transcript_14109/g.41891 Transcript_14109/m.41891 type:complete len:226 (+) Transcript_14109:218-895(+)